MNLTEFSRFQPEYLSVIKKELEMGLVSGLYHGEDPSLFPAFFEDYKLRMGQLGGERNMKQQEIADRLLRRAEELNPLLSVIQCTVDCQIKMILWNLEQKNPFEKEMRHVKNFEKKKNRLRRDIADLSDPQSIMFLKILNGKKNKKRKNETGEEIEPMTDSEIMDFIANMVVTKKQYLDRAIQDQQEFEEKMMKIPDYVKMLELQRKIAPFEKEWKEAEQKVGAESNQHGDQLESDRMTGTAVEYIIREKLQLSKGDVEIIKNCDWMGEKVASKKPKLLGEVDIVICDKSNGKVICLAECKARCFDIVAGWRQSSLQERRKKGKIGLKIVKSDGSEEIQKVGDVPVFVITCIQENEYILKFESTLKEDFFKHTLKREIRSEPLLSVQEIFDLIKPKYDEMMSPLEWFEKYSKDFLVVVK